MISIGNIGIATAYNICGLSPAFIIEAMQNLHFHRVVTFFLYKFMDPRLKQQLSIILRRKSKFLPQFKRLSLMWLAPTIIWKHPSSLACSLLVPITPSSSCSRVFILVVPFSAMLPVPPCYPQDLAQMLPL